MINFSKKIALLTTFFYYFMGLNAWAGVIVGGTRVIYDGAKREAILSVKNTSKIPYLIQAWADADGPLGKDKKNGKAPFIVTPPVFRLNEGNENIIRIIRIAAQLPTDKESMYWLNIKSIPSTNKNATNVLHVTVKTRIKLIFRPEEIKQPSETDLKLISFRKKADQLIVNNPTSSYITFYSLKIGNTLIKTNNNMVPPKGQAVYYLPEKNYSDHVTWRFINDFGGNSDNISSPLQ